LIEFQNQEIRRKSSEVTITDALHLKSVAALHCEILLLD